MFGIENFDLLVEECTRSADVNENSLLKVVMSPAMIESMKKAIASDKKLLAEVKKIEAYVEEEAPVVEADGDKERPAAKAPTDYPMPPSPISDPSSDTSDKGK